jgi:hypothetical protein
MLDVEFLIGSAASRGCGTSKSSAPKWRRLNFSAMGEGVAEGDGIDEFEA